MLPHSLLSFCRYELQFLLRTPEKSVFSHQSTLSQHFRANSHAYRTCQPTNERADEQRENHIKRPWFRPKRVFDVVSIGCQSIGVDLGYWGNRLRVRIDTAIFLVELL